MYKHKHKKSGNISAETTVWLQGKGKKIQENGEKI